MEAFRRRVIPQTHSTSPPNAVQACFTPRGSLMHDRGHVDALEGESPRGVLVHAKNMTPRSDMSPVRVHTNHVVYGVTMTDCRHSLPMISIFTTCIDHDTEGRVRIGGLVGTEETEVQVRYGSYLHYNTKEIAPVLRKSPYRPYPLSCIGDEWIHVIIKIFPLSVIRESKKAASYLCNEVASAAVATMLGVGAFLEVSYDPSKDNVLLISRNYRSGDLWVYMHKEDIYNEGVMEIFRFERILVMSVCSILRIHSHSLVHHDIKPENVCVRSTENLVFDLCLVDGQFAQSCDMNGYREMEPRGTMTYASPEKITEAAVLDPRCDDVWSLGMVLFVCLFGRLPYLLPPYPTSSDMAKSIVSYDFDDMSGADEYLEEYLEFFDSIFVPARLRPTSFDLWNTRVVQDACEKMKIDFSFQLQKDTIREPMKYTYRRWIEMIDECDSVCMGQHTRHPQTAATFSLIHQTVARSFDVDPEPLPTLFQM